MSKFSNTYQDIFPGTTLAPLKGMRRLIATYIIFLAYPGLALAKTEANPDASEKMSISSALILTFETVKNAVSDEPMSVRCTANSVPLKPGIDAFYKKSLEAGYLPTFSSANVSDNALREANCLIKHMLEMREDLLASLHESNTRIAIIGAHEQTLDIPEYYLLKQSKEGEDFWNRRARGFGPTPQLPLVSAGEENLLCMAEIDRYRGENIFIHEFAHAIHLTIKQSDPELAKAITKAYESAMRSERWKNTYNTENEGEYLASGAQAWFNAARLGPPGGDGIHNDIATRETLKAYDEPLANVLELIFGDTPWRYSCPEVRKKCY